MCDSISSCADAVTPDPVTDAIEEVTSLPGKAVGAAADSAWDKFVGSIVDGAEWAITEIMTLWLKAPDPDLQGNDSVVAFVTGHTAYVAGATMVAVLLWQAVRLMIYGRAEDAVNIGETLVRTALVSVCALALITASVELADVWSEWILSQADLEFGSGVLAGASIATGALWILALVVIITQLIQLGFMAVRNGMIVILAGTLTWSAAASGTDMGRQWFQKSCAWLLAFILYKPAAALIYAVAFELSGAKGAFNQLSGIFLMILAVFTLPALQRLFMPMVGAMGGANAGALAGAAVGAAVATGAMAATGGASGAGGFTGGTGSLAGAGGSSGGGGFGAAASIGGPPSGGGKSPKGADLAETGGTSSKSPPPGNPPGGGTPSGSSGEGAGSQSTLNEISSADALSGADGGGDSTSSSGTSTPTGAASSSSAASAPGSAGTTASSSYTSSTSPTTTPRSVVPRNTGAARHVQSSAEDLAGGSDDHSGLTGAGRADT